MLVNVEISFKNLPKLSECNLVIFSTRRKPEWVNDQQEKGKPTTALLKFENGMHQVKFFQIISSNRKISLKIFEVKPYEEEYSPATIFKHKATIQKHKSAKNTAESVAMALFSIKAGL